MQRITLRSRAFGEHFSVNSAVEIQKDSEDKNTVFESEASGDHGLLLPFVLRRHSNDHESSTVTHAR
jgi:hypothetical protein